MNIQCYHYTILGNSTKWNILYTDILQSIVTVHHLSLLVFLCLFLASWHTCTKPPARSRLTCCVSDYCKTDCALLNKKPISLKRFCLQLLTIWSKSTCQHLKLTDYHPLNDVCFRSNGTSCPLSKGFVNV